MKLVNKALILLTASTLIFSAGCKKKNAKDIVDDLSTEQIAQLADTSNWNKADINNLVVFIPEDTPIAGISTRQLDINAPIIKKLMANAATQLNNKISELESSLAVAVPDKRESIEISINTINSIRPLFNDYEKTAAEWGLDTKGHQDAIFYMNGTTGVVKFTVADSAKFKAHIMSTLKLKLDSKEIKVGDSTWQTFDITSLLEGKTCITCHDNKTVMPTTLAINYDKVVTITLVYKDDTATLEKLLKPAAKPMDKAAFGKVNDGTTALGFMDNVKLFTLFANSKLGKEFLSDEEVLGFELTPECQKDLTGIVALMPKMTFVSELNADSKLSVKTRLALSDPKDLQNIRDLHVSHLTMGTEKSLAALNVNIQLAKFIEYIKTITTAVNAKNYECKQMDDILKKPLNELVDSIGNPQLAMFTNALSSVNIAVDSLNPEKMQDLEVIANVSGTGISMVVSLAKALLGPAAAKLNLKLNETTEIDLSDIDESYPKLNAYMTQDDIIAATKTYDVKSIATGVKANDNKFINIMISGAMMSIMNAGSDVINSMNYSIGTDDSGVIFDMNVAY